MSEQVGEVNEHSRHWLNVTKLLRLVALILVGLGIVIIYSLDFGEIGGSMQWSNGKVSISAGSDPAMLLWSAFALALFILLMVRKPNAVTTGVPSMKCRVLAFVIDFPLSVMTIAPVGALIPLWIEAGGTGHFVWHFQRNYSVSGDAISGVSSLLGMALILFYFVFPLTRGRQTVGYFIMRLRVTPPFGDEGRFTFKAALTRTFYAFRGLLTFMTPGWDRDELGRTW